MMSKIQWTDVTDNPIIVKDGGWYCTKVSEGCQNCYAERINQSEFYGGNRLKYRHMKDQPELELRRDLLESWANLRKPKKHFVASMTDVFGEFVPDEWIFEILDAMRAVPSQTFQALTKRAERAFYVIGQWMNNRGLIEAPPNIWVGFSAENQKRFNERWEYGYSIYRNWDFTIFVSIEPMIGAVELPQSLLLLRNKVWIIIGGESGPNARPMSLDWAKRIDFQCQQADVPVFWKQLGAVQARNLGLSDSKGGDISEWPQGIGRREFPESIPVEPEPELAQARLF